MFEEDLLEIQKGIMDEAYYNEASIVNGIVLRILTSLGFYNKDNYKWLMHL